MKPLSAREPDLLSALKFSRCLPTQVVMCGSRLRLSRTLVVATGLILCASVLSGTASADTLLQKKQAQYARVRSQVRTARFAHRAPHRALRPGPLAPARAAPRDPRRDGAARGRGGRAQAPAAEPRAARDRAVQGRRPKDARDRPRLVVALADHERHGSRPAGRHRRQRHRRGDRRGARFDRASARAPGHRPAGVAGRQAQARGEAAPDPPRASPQAPAREGDRPAGEGDRGGGPDRPGTARAPGSQVARARPQDRRRRLRARCCATRSRSRR